MTEVRKPPERFILRTALCLSGPMLWALHFGAVYGAGHVGCTTGLVMGGELRSAVIGATLLALAAVAVFCVLSWRFQPRMFYRPVSLWLLALSAFGIFTAGLAAVILPACAPLR